VLAVTVAGKVAHKDQLAFARGLSFAGGLFYEIMISESFPGMKLFSACGFSGLFAIAVLVLVPETVSASKMQPGMMSHTGRVGLNANANCRRQRFNVCQGCHINIRMRVMQDSACTLNLQSLGPFAGQEVVVRPQNGIYGSANETASAYRPNPGYVGRDHFETRLYFEEGNGKRTFMNLGVNVFVAPYP
jgi:hypothetical protein